MASSIVLGIALYAMRITAQSTTTISMFLNMENSHSTPIITASIVRAGPTATTYVANCDYTDSSEQCAMTDLTVTTGPSWQDFTSSGPDGSYGMSCTFIGTTDGTCSFTQSADGSVYSDTINYADPTNPFPGFLPVLVTAGVEKLALESSPTASSIDASQTASSSKAGETGASSEATSSTLFQTGTSPVPGQATSGQAANGSKSVLPYTPGCLLSLLIVLGML
jgi:hypothetical protein